MTPSGCSVDAVYSLIRTPIVWALSVGLQPPVLQKEQKNIFMGGFKAQVNFATKQRLFRKANQLLIRDI